MCVHLSVHLLIYWGFGQRRQRLIVGQGEDAFARARWRAGLVEPVGVEPEGATRREGAGVTAGRGTGLLDGLLTVLVNASQNHSHNSGFQSPNCDITTSCCTLSQVGVCRLLSTGGRWSPGWTLLQARGSGGTTP